MPHSKRFGKIYFNLFLVTFKPYKVSDLRLWHLTSSRSSSYFGEPATDHCWKKNIISAPCESGEQTSSIARQILSSKLRGECGVGGGIKRVSDSPQMPSNIM